jgi:hypothetical protein
MAVQINPAVEPTIHDIEETLQNGLEALRDAPLNDQITAALKFLTPPGYRPIAQLEEDGRKKRSTAAGSNWNPETGEIVIYFEPLEPRKPGVREPMSKGSSENRPSTYSGFKQEVGAGERYDPLLMTRTERSLSTKRAVLKALGEPVDPLVTEGQIQQLCLALAQAEKAGRAFIALKRFRDDELINHGYAWTSSLAERQAVLAKAIDVGAVVTAQIPNPKAPQHPTTTVKLNGESKFAQAVVPRFQPIKLRGDGPSASEMLIRDRERF